MISESTFARRYTSFWQQLLPMGPAVIRVINRRLRRSFCDPLGEPSRPLRWDLVSELGLRWFGAGVENGGAAGGELPARRVAALGSEVAEFIRRQRGRDTPPLPGPSAPERDLAREIAHRLARFVAEQEPGRPLHPRPPFPGCGVLAHSSADLLAGTTLYEMKAGEESFRLVDLRQLLVYCALNSAAPRYSILRVGLINPRLGTFFHTELDWLARSMAGRDAVDLLLDVVDFLSTERISA